MELQSRLSSVTSNATKPQILTISINPPLHTPLHFHNQVKLFLINIRFLSFICSYCLGLQISTLRQKAMSMTVAPKWIGNFLPMHSLLVLGCACVLAEILFMITDTKLLERLWTSVAKIISAASKPHDIRICWVGKVSHHYISIVSFRVLLVLVTYLLYIALFSVIGPKFFKIFPTTSRIFISMYI